MGIYLGIKHRINYVIIIYLLNQQKFYRIGRKGESGGILSVLAACN